MQTFAAFRPFVKSTESLRSVPHDPTPVQVLLVLPFACVTLRKRALPCEQRACPSCACNTLFMVMHQSRMCALLSHVPSCITACTRPFLSYRPLSYRLHFLFFVLQHCCLTDCTCPFEIASTQNAHTLPSFLLGRKYPKLSPFRLPARIRHTSSGTALSLWP